MFGKGVYLADMSSKSANYCYSYISNNQALLLLCEAELGAPIQELTSASYSAGDDALAKGLLSTWGKGMTGPKSWKDAECIHSSLKGVKMVSSTFVKRKGYPLTQQSSRTQLTYQATLMFLEHIFNTTSISATMFLRFVSAIFSV